MPFSSDLTLSITTTNIGWYGGLGNGNVWSNSFTTGSSSRLLEGVDFSFQATKDSQYVRLYIASDNSGSIGANLVEMSAAAPTVTAGLNSFIPAAPFVFAPNTTYWLTVTAAGLPPEPSIFPWMPPQPGSYRVGLGGGGGSGYAQAPSLQGWSYGQINDNLIYNLYTNSDATAPALLTSTPVDNGTASVDANIVLTFSESVVARSGNIVLSDGASDVRLIPVTDATQVTISGSVVTINPSADLAANASYNIQMAAGVLSDIAGNYYAGISSPATLNFSTPNPSSSSSSSGGSSSSGSGGSDSSSAQVSVVVVDSTPVDPAPAATNFQLADSDGDGIREVMTVANGDVVDGNHDGVADYQQANVAGLRLINDGSLASDYGSLVVDGLTLSAVRLQYPASEGYLPITGRGGGTIIATWPEGVTNSFAGVLSFNVSGVSVGGSTEATLFFPSGLDSNSADAYIRFNYATNRFEEYVDAAGNPLYSFFDSNGDGIFDAVQLILVDGDPSWDGDGIANGYVVDPGFLAVGEREFSGTKRKDTITGNLLANKIKGKASNDWLEGGLGADVLIGGKGQDRYVYTNADDSAASARDTVRFGKGDRFVFSSFDGDSITDGHQKLNFIGRAIFSGSAGELRATRSVLEADLNGDTLADFAVKLRGNALIGNANLVL